MTTQEQWSPEDLGERPVSEKKVRKVRREIGVDAAASDPLPDVPTA
jgi:tRNA (adenine57-N1/adenine58-N1)-methyltransferase